MRAPGLLAIPLIAVVPAGCERATPAPVALRSFVLHDVQGMHGGFALWVAEDGSATVQVVGESPPGQVGLWEKRLQTKVTPEERAEFERLVAKYDFFRLKVKERSGIPDEGHPIIVVVTKDGATTRATKRANDKHPDFDPLYEYLRGICVRAGGTKPVWEGVYDWNWRPAGFEQPW